MKINDNEINNINIDFNDGTLHVSLVDSLDRLIAPKLREKVDTQIRELKPSCVVLDFSKVTFMDSGGLGFILGRSELLMELGGQLIIEKPNEDVRHLLSIAGIRRVKNIKVKKK